VQCENGDVRYRNGKLIRVDSDFEEDEERVFLFEGLLGKWLFNFLVDCWFYFK